MSSVISTLKNTSLWSTQIEAFLQLVSLEDLITAKLEVFSRSLGNREIPQDLNAVVIPLVKEAIQHYIESQQITTDFFDTLS